MKKFCKIKKLLFAFFFANAINRDVTKIFLFSMTSRKKLRKHGGGVVCTRFNIFLGNCIQVFESSTPRLNEDNKGRPGRFLTSECGSDLDGPFSLLAGIQDSPSA